MNEIIESEKKYLEHTENVITKEIEHCNEQEAIVKKDSLKLNFEDRLRGTHFNYNALLQEIGKVKDSLQRSESCPYFGRFDFQEDKGEVLPIYIGRAAITSDAKSVVYDWRSPICGLYYDSEIGPVSYNSPSGIQTGNILLKRQITVKNKELVNALDSSLATDDELLVPYLNVNADNRMKTIIASIQKEQNKIIRAIDSNIIVQGVAGSGKTSVALHRIAYLIYSMGDKIKANDFLVIGPNDYFLNYISATLPDLETTPVEQKTILTLMNDYLETNLSLASSELSSANDKQNMQKNISTFKGNFEYKDLLDKFVDECVNGNILVTDDFRIDGKVVFKADSIKKELFSEYGKNFERVSARYKSIYKENIDKIYDDLNQEYRKVYISLPMEDPIRKQYVEKSINLKKQIYEQGLKLLDKYFKNINKSCLALYVQFINSLNESELTLTDEEIRLLQKETLSNIKKKKVQFEDIAALMYLKFKITNQKITYKNVVIDEAQDYSIFAYHVFKSLFENAKFNIYGDLAQSIYPYRSISSWEEVNEKVFNNECNIMQLTKSYRTTIEITQVANNVLSTLNLSAAQPVLRHGQNLEYVDYKKDCNSKINKIFEWVKCGYKTIAVICKSEEEAQKTQEELISNGIESRYISDEDHKYSGGIFVLTAASAKGLEFDCVILNDASNDLYNVNNEVDMHLLYVASTRALHEQVIFYSKEITKPYQNEIQNNITLKKINENN